MRKLGRKIQFNTSPPKKYRNQFVFFDPGKCCLQRTFYARLFLIEITIQGFKLGNVLRIQVALVVILTTKVIFEAQAMQH